ncbi:phospholipase D-like domain-containing protein [Luteolibacter sp. AS25]|uniref:phospholipase D-like domain-containing protein n=1 Tax=Luteolibacter sp. AS25 TaxID=3135776 RepID=UPI00398AA984
MIGLSTQNSEPKTVALDPMMAGKRFAETTFRGTVLAAVKQPVTTVRQGVAVAVYRPREVLIGNLPPDLLPEPALENTPGTPAFEKMLDDEGFPKAEYGTLKWLVDGDEFFPELDRQIANARKSIKIQLYIFDNDDIAVRYADKLKQRSQEVDVNLLWDDFGTASAHLSSPETQPKKGFEAPSSMMDYITKDSDVEVRRTLNPWLVADHTKMLIFDDNTAIVGGMNMGREYYSEWHDLMVRVNGPIVGSMSGLFEKAWRTSGPFGDYASLWANKKFSKPSRPEGAIPMRILRTDAGSARQEILEASLLAIRGAKERILIVNPYFANDEIVLAVRGAAKRGVDVKVILAAEGDSAIMDIGNLATARVLIEAGAKLYRYPRMAHLKVMVCDNWATAGSANMDTLSMRINRELNISFSDKQEVETLVGKVFRPGIAKSRRMKLKDTDSAVAPVAEFVADQL